jgi:hypothetical protein
MRAFFLAVLVCGLPGALLGADEFDADDLGRVPSFPKSVSSMVEAKARFEDENEGRGRLSCLKDVNRLCPDRWGHG